MKKSEIDIGGVYVAKVSGKLTRLRIERESPHGGWEATNLETKRGVRVKSPRRLRYVAQGLEVDHVPTPAEEPPPPIEYDPDRCWVAGCIKPPMVNCLGKPMCQEHWDDHCAETDTPDESDAAASARGESNDQNESENDMAKKNSKKTGSKKNTTKAAKPAKARAPKPPAEKKVSALDAAAIVLTKAKKPMGTKDLIAAMAEQGLWTSPGGKTPHATLYAALLREINVKGKESRFRKADKGQFETA